MKNTDFAKNKEYIDPARKLNSLAEAISFWHKKSGNNQKPVIVTLNDLQKQDV